MRDLSLKSQSIANLRRAIILVILRHKPHLTTKPRKVSKKTGRKSVSRGRKKQLGTPKRGSIKGQQKLDIVGVLLALTGIILLLALLSPTNSAIVTRVVQALHNFFGLGRFVAPLLCLTLGIWVMLRQFSEQLPRIRPEQVLGALLLLIALHASLGTNVTNGGVVGQYLLLSLVQGLGKMGALVALIAWIFVSLILTFGTSIGQLANTIKNASAHWQDSHQQNDGKHDGQHIPLEEAKDIGTKSNSMPAPKRRLGRQGILRRRDQTTEVSEDSESVIASPETPEDDRLRNWTLPIVEDILSIGTELTVDDEYDRQRAQTIEETLESFGAPGRVIEINRGPTITQFGVEPDFVTTRGGKRTKVKVNKISKLADDLALALAAASIRIEAPVPGKGVVGIEVPNTESSQVALRDLMDSKEFQKLNTPLALCLGQDVSGRAVCTDLATMPHLLIAGTTGSGKSVCVNGIIATLLLRNSPDQLKMLMIDPKRVELTTYRHIPHLLVPVIVDLNKVVPSLQWIAREMDNRYTKFAETGARNIEDFNQRVGDDDEEHLPYLVIVVDELADLMMVAPEDTERILTRLAQMARATGIHMIIATQRPSVDVVTGLIKANFPARVAFAVASLIDSRVILDQPGAEQLLGRGDMLFQAPDAPQPLRMQGTFVSDVELRQLVRHWRGFYNKTSPETEIVGATKHEENHNTGDDEPTKDLWEDMETLAAESGRDELFSKAVETVRADKRASISMLQRRLRIGYTRAAKLIDAMEEAGIIGPAQKGAKQREVLQTDSRETDTLTDTSPE